VEEFGGERKCALVKQALEGALCPQVIERLVLLSVRTKNGAVVAGAVALGQQQRLASARCFSIMPVPAVSVTQSTAAAQMAGHLLRVLGHQDAAFADAHVLHSRHDIIGSAFSCS
jgi:hypothetical protein